MEERNKKAVVLNELNPSVQKGMDQYGFADQWSEILSLATKTQLENFGYYIVVDLDTKNKRYSELTKSQTGITKTQRALGQELSIDHLFFISMTAEPTVECKIEKIVDKVSSSITALKSFSFIELMSFKIELGLSFNEEIESNLKVEKKTLLDDIIKPTGVLYIKLFLESTLVNVKTGRSISYSLQEPFRLENQVGNTECPSEF